jgi:predicted nucleotidyltransferase
MPTMKDETFAEYLPHIRRRWIEEQRGWELRRERAWASARRAADVLRRFGATRVIAFGSLARAGWYDERSDIDLAEEGIPPGKFWRASADAANSVGDFELDVVDLADCQPPLREIILREGVPL